MDLVTQLRQRDAAVIAHHKRAGKKVEAPFTLEGMAAVEIERLRAAIRHLSEVGDICVYDDLSEICPGCRCPRQAQAT